MYDGTTQPERVNSPLGAWPEERPIRYLGGHLIGRIHNRTLFFHFLATKWTESCKHASTVNVGPLSKVSKGRHRKRTLHQANRSWSLRISLYLFIYEYSRGFNKESPYKQSKIFQLPAYSCRRVSTRTLATAILHLYQKVSTTQQNLPMLVFRQFKV